MADSGAPDRPVLAAIVLWVDDVPRSVSFYERALGFACRFLDERELYAELDTGETRLALTQRAFALDQIGEPGSASGPAVAASVEIAFAVNDVDRAVTSTVEAGATLVQAAAMKYWGQTVAYVRDPDGHLLQICTHLAD